MKELVSKDVFLFFDQEKVKKLLVKSSWKHSKFHLLSQTYFYRTPYFIKYWFNANFI